MHQSFRLNGSDYYTIFDLPIQVTNQIPDSSSRASCDALNNRILANDQINATGPPTILPYSVGKIGNRAPMLQAHIFPIMFALLVFGMVELI
jgi:hypothetical protein